MILHIVPKNSWHAEAARGKGYRGDTLESEGFIHFSTTAQVGSAILAALEETLGRPSLGPRRAPRLTFGGDDGVMGPGISG